jgi:MYXO-CTERM domain-containing protein
VTVRANDLAGNASPVSAASTVVLDRTAPSVAVVTAPEEGASLPPGTIAITGTAEPGATVNVVVDAVTHTTTADASGGFQVDVDLAAGNHFVTATVVDPAGNASAASGRSFVVAAPPADDPGGGGCGCGPGGASAPEGLLLVVAGLGLFRRRRVPNPANLYRG